MTHYEQFESLQSMLDKRPRVPHRALINALVKLGEPVTAEKLKLAAHKTGYMYAEGAERSWDLTDENGVFDPNIATEIDNAFNEALERSVQDGQ